MEKAHLNDDADLLRLLRENKEEAFSLIYKKYWAALFDAAYKRLKSKEACEEIVQDIFVDFYARCSGINITHSLPAYLFTSLKYKVLNYLRAGRALEQYRALAKDRPFPAAAFVPHEIKLKELECAIEQSIERLPEKCRKAFLLSRYEHLTHASIAERMSISVNTVEKHITKALKLLRGYLKEYDALLAFVVLQTFVTP